MGQKPALPRRSIAVRFAPNKQTLTEQVQCDAMCASSGLMQCSKTPPLPDVPALADFLPGYEANAWIGIGAPKKTPVEIIDQLNKEINVGFADPKIAARIADLASRAFIASPADLDKLVVEYTKKWGKVRQRTSRPSDHNLVGRTFHVRIPKTRGPLRESF